MAPHIFAFKYKNRWARYIKDREAICLTTDQARHVYKTVESESIVNTETIKQEIGADKLDNNNNNREEEEEINPYQEIITNKVEKDYMVISQMAQWSVLSNVVNYVQYNRHPRNYYHLDIKNVDQKGHKKIYGNEEKRLILELDFGNTPEKLRGDYLDMYKGM